MLDCLSSQKYYHFVRLMGKNFMFFLAFALASALPFHLQSRVYITEVCCNVTSVQTM